MRWPGLERHFKGHRAVTVSYCILPRTSELYQIQDAAGDVQGRDRVEQQRRKDWTDADHLRKGLELARLSRPPQNNGGEGHVFSANEN